MSNGASAGTNVATANIGAIVGLVAAERQQKTAESLAKKQRNWQYKMRATAYQDTMNDMALAGLNPILAYKQGATTAGQGAVAQSVDIGGAISTGAATAMKGAKLGSEKGLLQQQANTAKSAQDLNTSLSVKAQAEGHLAAEKAQNTAYEGARWRSLLSKYVTDLEFNLSPEGKRFNRLDRLNVPYAGDIGFGIEQIRPILQDLKQRYESSKAQRGRTPKKRPPTHTGPPTLQQLRRFR